MKFIGELYCHSSEFMELKFLRELSMLLIAIVPTNQRAKKSEIFTFGKTFQKLKLAFNYT